jgi:hypothetical protein
MDKVNVENVEELELSSVCARKTTQSSVVGLQGSLLHSPFCSGLGRMN